jgi:hypothetical protein
MVGADAYEFRIDGAWPESAMAVTERGADSAEWHRPRSARTSDPALRPFQVRVLSA